MKEWKVIVAVTKPDGTVIGLPATLQVLNDTTKYTVFDALLQDIRMALIDQGMFK